MAKSQMGQLFDGLHPDLFGEHPQFLVFFHVRNTLYPFYLMGHFVVFLTIAARRRSPDCFHYTITASPCRLARRQCGIKSALLIFAMV